MHRLLPSLPTWPTWYLLLIAYTAILGVLTLRHQSGIAAQLKAYEKTVTDPRQRGELAGRRAAGWTRSLGWFVAAGLLLTGRGWATIKRLIPLAATLVALASIPR